MLSGLLAVLTMTLLPVVAQPSPEASAPSAISPDTIYLSAARVTKQDAVPPFMLYDVHVDSSKTDVQTTVDADGHSTSAFSLDTTSADRHADYRVWYRSSDGRALTQDLQTRAVAFLVHPWPLSASSRVTQVVVRGGASPIPSPSPQSSIDEPPSAQKVLGDVSVQSSRYYQISLVGLEQLDGQPVYHLALRAYGSPNDHPLTDLYVDEASMHVRRAIAEFNFRTALYRVAAKLDLHFAQIGPYWLNDTGTLTAGAHVTMFHVNGSYAYGASHVEFPVDIPEWYFDEQLYKAHYAATPSLHV